MQAASGQSRVATGSRKLKEASSQQKSGLYLPDSVANRRRPLCSVRFAIGQYQKPKYLQAWQGGHAQRATSPVAGRGSAPPTAEILSERQSKQTRSGRQ